jgi:thiamine pyrophosphate-dependent acetolactate synthase large subunit-like protein
MMNRQEAARALVGALTDQLLVTGLGNASWDMYTAGDRALNFYTRGGMGTATSVAFGLARARPDDRIVCVEGEGSLLMNLGSLATIGRYAPQNLTCFIWDNQAYQITGGQPTHTEAGVDLAAVARGCRIKSAVLVDSLDQFKALLPRVLDAAGPHVVVAKVDRSRAEGRQPYRTLLLKYRFMAKIGTLPDVAALAWE